MSKTLPQITSASIKTLLPAMGYLAACVMLFASTAANILTEWLGSGPYSHGLLAFVVICYLLWRDRHSLRLDEPLPWLFVIALPVALFGWWLAAIANVFTVQVMALYVVFSAGLVCLYGINSIRYLVLPLLCLALIMPVWQWLQTPLQIVSADVTSIILSVTNIPVYRQEFVFTVPGGSFIIEEACSGMGFFLCAGLLAIVFARLYRLTWYASLFLFVTALLMAMVSNWVRIAAIMIVGNQTSMEHPIVTDHLTFGWIIFSIAQILFVLFANRLFGAAPDRIELNSPLSAAQAKANIVRFVGVIAFVAIVPIMHYTIQLTGASSITVQSDWFANTATNQFRMSLNQQNISVAPDFAGADEIETLRATYSNQELSLLKVQFVQQTQGKELINVNNSIFDETRWVRTPLPPQLSDEQPFNVLRLIDARGNLRTIAYVYIVNDRLIKRPVKAKLQEVIAYFRGNQNSYLVALIMDHGRTEKNELFISASNSFIDQLKLTLVDENFDK